MKKRFALLLALAMLFAMVSCDLGENPSGSTPQNDDPPVNTDGSTSKTDPKETDPPTPTKCMFCFDMEGNDRKCDECGFWIYERGEAWTKEVPENVKVTLIDHLYNYYVIEMIGDEVYSKGYYNKNEYESDGNRVEDFTTMTDCYTRDHYNGEQGEWRKNNFSVAYGDVYELFAVKVLQNLKGSSLSNTVESSLDATVVGNETIAGKPCVVKEYDGNFGVRYKVWMWNNIPLKTAQMNTTSETEYKIMYEILEWDESITAFSSEMPK